MSPSPDVATLGREEIQSSTEPLLVPTMIAASRSIDVSSVDCATAHANFTARCGASQVVSRV
jgi:hypothetical protein